MKAGNYKDLMVWRESILFVPEVYRILERFPSEERFDLCSQIRRAVVSVPANIAEGQARSYRKSFLQHLRVAKGSLAEVHTLFIIAEQLGYVSPIDLELIEQSIERIAKPLHGLISRVARDVGVEQ